MGGWAEQIEITESCPDTSLRVLSANNILHGTFFPCLLEAYGGEFKHWGSREEVSFSCPCFSSQQWGWQCSWAQLWALADRMGGNGNQCCERYQCCWRMLPCSCALKQDAFQRERTGSASSKGRRKPTGSMHVIPLLPWLSLQNYWRARQLGYHNASNCLYIFQHALPIFPVGISLGSAEAQTLSHILHLPHCQLLTVPSP